MSQHLKIKAEKHSTNIAEIKYGSLCCNAPINTRENNHKLNAYLVSNALVNAKENSYKLTKEIAVPIVIPANIVTSLLQKQWAYHELSQVC